MCASMNRSRRSRRGVTFDALHTKEPIDKNGDSINKLTSMVNKIDMKVDRREAQYRPTVYQNRNRGCRQRQENHRPRNRSQSRDRGQTFSKTEEEKTPIRTEIIGPIIESVIDQAMTMVKMITGEMSGIVVEQAIGTMTMVVKGEIIEIEV